MSSLHAIELRLIHGGMNGTEVSPNLSLIESKPVTKKASYPDVPWYADEEMVDRWLQAGYTKESQEETTVTLPQSGIFAWFKDLLGL